MNANVLPSVGGVGLYAIGPLNTKMLQQMNIVGTLQGLPLAQYPLFQYKITNVLKYLIWRPKKARRSEVFHEQLL